MKMLQQRRYYILFNGLNPLVLSRRNPHFGQHIKSHKAANVKMSVRQADLKMIMLQKRVTKLIYVVFIKVLFYHNCGTTLV